ncbi:MAG: dephospho-CoA kinase [Bacteroidaceae bacterium]|nr:dephospho-CoA kinase [Bacteroidaceae bacterium]
MICVAITGGIGSGKSYVSAMLEERGIPVYNADTESKRLTLSNAEIRNKLIALLGEEVYANGELNKPMLASYLFASAENAVRINGIIHPVVKEDFKRWLTNHAEKDITAFESAILYEAGFEDTVDAVLMVFAPRELRLERAMKRDKATREQIEARMDAQMSEEEKCRRADFVVYNDGTLPLDKQLTSVINLLKKK